MAKNKKINKNLYANNNIDVKIIAKNSKIKYIITGALILIALILILVIKIKPVDNHLLKEGNCYMRLEIVKDNSLEKQYQKIESTCKTTDDCKDYLIKQGVAKSDADKINFKCE